MIVSPETMPSAVLHDYWRSSASYRVRIALNLKNIAYRAAPVDLLARAHKAQPHLARQPQGLVPVLEIDDRTLIQSLAIIEYLDETRPEPPLLPGDPPGRQRVRALADMIAMDIHPVCNLGVVNHVLERTDGGDREKSDWMQHFIAPGLRAFEALLDDPATGRLCHGDTPTLADICLVPQVYNARRWQVAIPPRIAAIDAACGEIDAFRAAHPDAIGPPPAT